MDGYQVLDLFAGTGALGLEALSRGADRAIFVDISLKALTIINKNINTLGLESRTRVVRHDITRGLNPVTKLMPRIDLVFMDPPYGKNLAPRILQRLEALPELIEGAVIVVEHFRNELDGATFKTLSLLSARAYGQTIISLFEKVKADRLGETLLTQAMEK